MKPIAILLTCLFTLGLSAQEKNKTIQKQGSITIVENGQKREYLFDVDTAILLNSANGDINEALENLNASFEIEQKDTLINGETRHIEKIFIVDDSTQVKHKEFIVMEGADKTRIEIGDKEFIRVEEGGDTVIIKIGKKTMRVVEKDNRSELTFDDESAEKEVEEDFEFDWDWECNKKDSKKFKGHYGLMEFGMNTYTDPDYSMYEADEEHFMDLNYNKAREFNLNIFWQSFGLQKNKGNIGLVTGLGFSWNNYFFAKDVTLAQGDHMVEPVFTEEIEGYGYVEKTKLVASYLTVPLLLEVHLTSGDSPLYVQVGAIGGIKLGSHTKVKHGGNKDKNFSDFYLAPFRYGGTVRLGYGAIYLYGNYFASEMFRSDRGPVMNPYTIGIGFPAF